jgi:hypothetical protein
MFRKLAIWRGWPFGQLLRVFFRLYRHGTYRDPPATQRLCEPRRAWHVSGIREVR